MTHFQGKIIWIIGASEGLGREVAKELDQAGASVIVSARSSERLNELVSDCAGARALPLDVTDMTSVHQATQQLDRIDHVIYNAGAYDPMATQDWNSNAALRMVDVNFVGAMRVLGDVVPHMVKQGAGDITLIGSLAGYRGLPNAIGYGASKAALISLAETMRHDLKGSGITVRIVNPGFIKTRLTEKNSFAMPQLMPVETAAAHVLRAMKSKRFRTDFPRPFSWAIKVLQLMPDWLVYRGK